MTEYFTTKVTGVKQREVASRVVELQKRGFKVAESKRVGKRYHITLKRKDENYMPTNRRGGEWWL